MKLKTLKKLGKHPTWCGPSALSILTGRSINHCARVIAKQRNDWGWYNGRGSSKQVRGTHTREVRKALDSMGFMMVPVKIPKGVTLRSYMAGRGGEQFKNSMLLEVTRHWMSAHMDVVSDNHGTDHYSKHPKRLKRMVRGWIVRTKPKS